LTGASWVQTFEGQCCVGGLDKDEKKLGLRSVEDYPYDNLEDQFEGKEPNVFFRAKNCPSRF